MEQVPHLYQCSQVVGDIALVWLQVFLQEWVEVEEQQLVGAHHPGDQRHHRNASLKSFPAGLLQPSEELL
jgi:hypothetical protein